ncbi:hypothetical protein PI93_014610 [Pandoraea fibrosis]|uniref:Uncharacterized protein n=1 Tax=Pandoraea fibrosis TaxID=1891094 RepID=A0ABX6HTB8_9BURK|nr:hypothetical protein [Pandoraea fibrosis]QHE92708.1 hypothetical protein PJ20_013390 [Pandoraea fibrosis]QHF13735.1 hypothetical protein PI93_014610 [Pandoraea fibrosis]
MSLNEPSSPIAVANLVPAPEAADAMIEHRYPSDIDRLREAIGSDVLPFYRDEQAFVASQQASQRWPHLVAVADSRDTTLSAAPASNQG